MPTEDTSLWRDNLLEKPFWERGQITYNLLIDTIPQDNCPDIAGLPHRTTGAWL